MIVANSVPPERPNAPDESRGATDRSRSGIRRRGRRDRAQARVLVRSALLGAVIALLVSGLLHIAIIGLARGATPEGRVPAQMGLRLWYAWYTLSTEVVALGRRIVGGLGYAPLIALAGALVGVLVYLVPIRIARRSRGTRIRRRREKY